MNDNNVTRGRGSTFAHISEQARIFQEGVKKDALPQIKKLVSIGVGHLFGHSATELKEEEKVSTSDKVVLDHAESKEPKYLETAKKIGSQIQCFLKMIVDVAAFSKATFTEKAHVTKKKTQFPTSFKMEQNESVKALSNPASQERIAAKEIDKNTTMLRLEKETEKLSAALTKLDQFEEKAETLPKDKRENFLQEIAAGRKKLRTELNRVVVEIKSLQPNRVSSLPEDRIPVYKSMIKTCDNVIAVLSKFPPSEGVLSQINHLKKEQTDLEKFLKIDEKTANSRAKNVLDKRTFENMETIIDFHRNRESSHANSKLVFNTDTQTFLIMGKKQRVKEPYTENNAAVFTEIDHCLHEVLKQVDAKKIPAADLIFGETRVFPLSMVYDWIQRDSKAQANPSFMQKLNTLIVGNQLSDVTNLKKILSEWRNNKDTVAFFRQHSGLSDDELFAIDESRPWEKIRLGDLIEDKPDKKDSFYTLADGAILGAEKRKLNPYEEYQKLIDSKYKRKEEEIKLAERRIKDDSPPPLAQLEKELSALKISPQIDTGAIEKKEAQIRLVNRPSLLRNDLIKLKNENILTSSLLVEDIKTAGKAQSETLNALNKMFVAYTNTKYLPTYYGSIDVGMVIEHARWNQEAQKILKQAKLENFIQDRNEISSLFEKCRDNPGYLPQLFEKLKAFKKNYPPILSPAQQDILAKGKEKLGTPLPKVIEKEANGLIKHADPVLAKEWNEKWSSKK